MAGLSSQPLEVIDLFPGEPGRPADAAGDLPEGGRSSGGVRDGRHLAHQRGDLGEHVAGDRTRDPEMQI
jgi:hypothetical protein